VAAPGSLVLRQDGDTDVSGQRTGGEQEDALGGNGERVSRNEPDTKDRQRECQIKS
jgi:hypothetical protein